MTGTEIIAASLLASVATSAMAAAVAGGLDRITGDPRMRDRAWGLALHLPLLPPVVTAAALIVPAPVAAPIVGAFPTIVGTSLPSPDIGQAAIGSVASAAPSVSTLEVAIVVLGFAGAAALVQALLLARRTLRLRRLMDKSRQAPDDIRDRVRTQARSLGLRTPRLRIGGRPGEALLCGALKPVLILPPDIDALGPTGDAIIRHELCHLRRGDHRTIWLDEAARVLTAFNPLARWILSRRIAAREEACDAQALDRASPDRRRLYAQGLIQALRANPVPLRTPALTFNGTPRSRAMRRLKSILNPPVAAGRRLRAIALTSGAVLVSGAGFAGLALAAGHVRPTPVSQASDPTSASVSRFQAATAADGQLYCAAPADNRDRAFGCQTKIWHVAEIEERRPTGAFCTPSTNVPANLEAIAERTRPYILMSDDTSGTALDGARRALIAAFPCQGEPQAPDMAAVAQREDRLKAAWGAQSAAVSAAESAAIAARLTLETPADIKSNCSPGGDPEASCNGMIFGMTIGESMKPAGERRHCAPNDVERSGELADRTKAAIRSTSANPGETGRAFALRVMAETWPCRA